MNKVIIDKNKCYKCGFCILFEFCENNAISSDNPNIEYANEVFIDTNKCIGCLKCIEKSYCNSFLIKDLDSNKITCNTKFELNELDGIKPIIRKKSEVNFEDGVISKYGNYFTKEEMPNFDFQFLEMKPNTEDAHVHDKELEVMVLWGGSFTVWVKENGRTKIVKSDGEQTVVMVPPGYAHGVRVLGDTIVKIIIIYFPKIDNWP